MSPHVLAAVCAQRNRALDFCAQMEAALVDCQAQLAQAISSAQVWYREAAILREALGGPVPAEVRARWEGVPLDTPQTVLAAEAGVPPGGADAGPRRAPRAERATRGASA